MNRGAGAYVKLRCSRKESDPLVTVRRLLAPANLLCQPAREAGCHFRKVTRSEPGPAPSKGPRYSRYLQVY